MIPEDLKKMFGLKDTKDLNMANNIWKMLDQMSDSDPQQYKKFVQKNMKEGMEDAKKQKDQKQKPFKIKPKIGFCLKMAASINQKPLESSLNQKVLVTKLSWADVRSKFESSVKLIFTVTHTERIKLSRSKSTKKEIQKYSFKDLNDIQLFYYSLQGPVNYKNEKGTYQFCMILNSKFYQDILNQNGGKKLLMSLCISYFQERLSLDKNPLLDKYNPDEYRRLAFYTINKYSLQISQKQYCFNGYYQPQQFLLEKQIDSKRNQEKKQAHKQQQKPKPKPQIKFKQQKIEQPEIPLITTNTEPKKQKKVLIEVLKQERNQNSNQISYNMKQTEQGYFFQFLIPGIASIKQVDLEMKKDCIRLKVKDKNELLVQLNKLINQDTIKAKLKKNENLLKVQAKFN